jgi:anaerobic magnesium-protoporphyrin IX monomethyl ester cyclase
MKSHSFLFVQPMHEKKIRTKRTSIDFPWGLGFMAGLMAREGHDVKILDGQALQLEKQELAPLLDDYDVDIVGISAFSTQFPAVRYLAEHVKRTRPGTAVIVGGPMASYHGEFTLRETAADVVVIGEGELTILDLLRNWDNKETVEGIGFKKDGKIHFTPKREALISLDDLPMPNFDLFEMWRYTRANNSFARKDNDGNKVMGIFAARGCPYSCHFCSLSSLNYRTMSPQKVYESVRELRDTFGLQEIFFEDELFLASKKKFADLAPKLKSLDLPWAGQGRINVMDDEFLAMAKDANCIGVGYGVESGSQKILDNMNKHTKVEKIEQVLKATPRAGINMKVQLMFGYPGETEETVQQTIDLMRRVDHPGRRMTLTTPIPGSELYDTCVADGRISDEVTYLSRLEKSFGHGEVHVNFTPWPDDEVYPRKTEAEEAMMRNYISNRPARRVRHFIGGIKRKLISSPKAA